MSADGQIDPTGFGNAAGDYATHRAGFPPELVRRLEAFGVGTPGQCLVDLGTGTGTLARQFAAKAVDVIGIDPDERMLASAAALAATDGVTLDLRAVSAEETGLQDSFADAVTAGQCWHWFDEAAAAAEAHRILKPGGALAVCYFDWIPLPGNAVEATERLINEHNPNWALGGGYGMWPMWAPAIQAAGFREIETFSFDVVVPYTPEGWRGRIRASAGITTLDESARQGFDDALAGLLARDFPGEIVPMEHRVWALVGRAGSPHRR